MSVSMHALALPVINQMLRNMSRWLDKAEAHAAAKRFDPNNYLTMRLTPDMLAFPRQIQIACDNAKGCVARLAGMEIPKFEDNEASLADLKARIAKTLDFVNSVPASAFEGSESRPIEIPMRNADPLKFNGQAYLLHFALPNIYFHVTTAYALLRQAGVEIGKGDYLGAQR
jgi:uncharacterized protein